MRFLAGVLAGFGFALVVVLIVGRWLVPRIRPAPRGAIASEKQQYREQAVAILRSEDGDHRQVVKSREESA